MKTFLVFCFLLSLPLQAQRLDQELSTGWKFIRQDVGPTVQPDNWEAVTVPHTWNAQDGQLGKYYRGACWYSYALPVPQDWKNQRVFIRFEAACLVARVYLNGKLLGEHRGAFTAFSFELTPWLQFGGANELRVQVDNRGQPDIAPLSGDFNLDGGLYRPVHLLVTDQVCISPLDFASSGLYLTTKALSDTSAQVEVKTILSSNSSNPEMVQITTILKDASGQIVATHQDTASIPPDQTATCAPVITINQPHRWNGRNDPYLYSATVQVQRNGTPVDEVVQSFGLRTAEISQEKGFLLNGRPYPIYGVNRHQDQFNQGWALQPADEEEDARLLLDLGVTAIRNTHYPQSTSWHDLADHKGLLLWDEVSLVDGINGTPEFAANARLQLAELMHQLYNHPSICFWGIFNELYNNAKTADPVPLLTQLKADIQALDTSRIIVAASDHGNKPCNQIPDALCLNTYPGWYGGNATQMSDRINGTYKEFGGKRIALSEYGAGGNPAQHEEGDPPAEVKNGGPFHPEEYQDYVHENDYAAIKDNPKVWGSFLWVAFDFPSARRKEGGSVGLNDKGLITQDRKTKKDAYYFYQANWTQQPMVYLASRRFTPRFQPSTLVRVYSNCAQVELKVNGQSLGTVSPNSVNVFYWPKVILQPGRNDIEAIGITPQGTVADHCQWTLENAPAAASSPN